MGYPKRHRKFYCRTCGMKFDNYDLNGKYYLDNHEKTCISHKKYYNNNYTHSSYQDNHTHSNYSHKGKNRKALVFVGAILSFCILSIVGTIIIDSDNYFDVELSMVFYYNILTAVIYQDEIQRDIFNFDTDKVVSHIDEIGIKTTKKLNDKRIAETQKIEREYESLIFTYTNNERVEQGLKPLRLNEKISDVARLHSQDMLVNDFFEHDNLRGQTPTDRGNVLGVSCVKNYGSYYTKGLGENISYLDGSLFLHVTENSKTLVDGWMESKGHRENILEKNYDQIGIGVKFSYLKVYATQNFC